MSCTALLGGDENSPQDGFSYYSSDKKDPI